MNEQAHLSVQGKLSEIFLKNDSLYEPTSSLVERFLLRDFRIINPTLFFSRNEAEMRIIETVRISTANSFAISEIVSFI